MEKISFCIALLFSFIIFYSCSEKEKTKFKPQNQITLIFENPPADSFYIYRKNKIRVLADFKVRYNDDNMLPISISPNPETTRDTFRILTSRNVLELQHSYSGMEKLSFFLRNGDTVLFNYKTKIPRAEILNRKTKSYDLTYEEKRKEELYKNDLAPSINYFIPILTIDDFVFRDKKDQKHFKDSVYSVIEKFYDRENSFLDSLKAAGLMSASVYDLYKAKAFFNFTVIQFMQNESNKEFVQKEMTKGEIKNSLNGTYDSLLYYGFYNNFITEVRRQYYDLKAPRVTAPQSFRPDYRVVYDSIVKNHFISTSVKKALLLNTLQEIIRDNSTTEIKKYTDKFKKDINDSVWYNYVLKENNIDFNSSNDLLLKDSLGRVYKFDELIKKHSGKVIYVDFWASWCAPCIKELPASKELQNGYKGKNVEFIFLSSDNNTQQWKKAMKKYNVKVSSFIIDNMKSSKLLEDLNFNLIPRHLVFDKKGNLVEKNAPRPGKEAQKLIDKYLLK